MATDKLINQSQGDDIINALDDIATGVGNISYGEQTSADKVVAMTGYQKESTAAAISPGDSLNVAIGKLEKKVDDNTANKVAGPSSTVVDENIVLFDGSDGKTVKSSGVAISKSTDQYPVVDDDAHIPTTKVVKRYVDETATGISRYLGTITSVSDLDTDAKKGDFYIAAAAWGDVHVCDEIIAEKDNPSQIIDGTNWRLLHNEAIPIVDAWPQNPTNATTPGTLLVDTRLDTDESNIAYNLDNGVKNLLNITSFYESGSNTETVINADKSVTINYTSSESVSYVHLFFDGWNSTGWHPTPSIFVGALFSGVPDDIPNENILLLIEFSDDGVNWRYQISLSYSSKGPLTIPNYPYMRLAARFENASTQTITFKPMICTQSTWDVSSTHTPYALSNPVLTSGLSEVIDAGPKNRFILSPQVIADKRATHTISGNSITVTSNGNWAFAYTPIDLPRGLYVLDLDITASTADPSTDTQHITLYNDLTFAGNVASLTITGTGHYSLLFPSSGSRLYLTWYVNITGTSSTTNTMTVTNHMICTKAEWDISHKYVAHSNLNSEITANLVDTVNNGPKNLLQNTGVSTTIKDVTFTVNADGSVSTSGTSNAATVIFYINKFFTFESGVEYVVSGCPSGGSVNGYRFCNMGNTYVNDYGQGGETVIGDGSVRQMAIYVNNSGTDMNGLTFKPMICKKSDWDISRRYVPHIFSDNTLRSKLAEVIDNIGGKNIVRAINKTYSSGGITAVVNEYNEVIMSGSRSASTAVTVCRDMITGLDSLFQTRTTIPAGEYVMSIEDKAGFAFVVVAHNGVDQSISLGESSVGSNHFTYTAEQKASYPYIGVNIWCGSNVSFANYGEKFQFMLCTASSYDVSNKFVSPGLPNTVITPELIDIVDSGPKNLLNLETCSISSTHGAVTFTVSGNTITVSSTGPSDVQEVRIANISLPVNVDLAISGCPADGSESTYSVDAFNNGGWIPGQTGDTGNGEITRFATMTNSRIRIRIAPNATFTNKVFNMMVCTKAAWDVSHKFVPYRPPYDGLEAKSHQIEITSESDLDNLPAGTVTGNLVAMIAGVQAGQWVTVRTIDLNTSSGTNRRRMQVMISAGGLVASRLYHNSAWLQWYFGHNDATKIFERTTSGNETITNISPYGSFQLIAYDTTNKDAFSASFPRSSLSGNLKLSVTGANGAVLGTILRSGSTTTYACTVANGYTLVLFGY